MNRKTKIKFTDFEYNLLINGMNEFRNMFLVEDLPTKDVDELLRKIIDKSENKVVVIMSNRNSINYRIVGDYNILNLALPPEEGNMNLALPPEEGNIKLYKRGMFHKDIIKQTSNKCAIHIHICFDF